MAQLKIPRVLLVSCTCPLKPGADLPEALYSQSQLTYGDSKFVILGGNNGDRTYSEYNYDIYE